MSKITIRLYIIIIMTVLVLTLILPLLNNSYAVSKLKPGETTKDISRVDKTKYPGIVERINILKKKYPNWEFEFYKTGLDWDTFIQLEYAPERNKSPLNLVHQSFSGEWICDYRGTSKFDSGSWYAASYKAIEYTIDPRTYLNEFEIFALKKLSANTLSESESLAIIKTSLEGKSYAKHADLIYRVAKEENVDFVDVLARLIQEQGSGTVLTDGNRSVDPKDTKLYYNPYNWGATGNTAADVIINATNRAKVKGWDTFEKGLRGGIKEHKINYAKQNSAYFEKFNATESDYSGRYHQYMQNITAPFSEGELKKDQYKLLDPDLKMHKYTFVIPLYENMQKAATTAPNSFLASPSNNGQVLTEPKLPADAVISDTDGLFLRKGPGSSYSSIKLLTVGTKIKVLKKDINNWYYVELTADEKGYIARRVGQDKDYFVFYPQASMKGITRDYRYSENQDSPDLPIRAEMTYATNVRTAPTLYGSRVRTTLPIKSIISIRERMPDKDGEMWYKIFYRLTETGGFLHSGYITRGNINTKYYRFGYLDLIDLNKVDESEKPTTPPVTQKDVKLSNQKNPTLPRVAILNEPVRVRRGSGSLSAPTIRILPKNSKISVRRKVANSNGYEWYFIYYNWNGKGFNNTGYMARNIVNSTNYYFTFITNPDWSTCAFLKSIQASTPVTVPKPVTSYPRTAKTITTLNVRRGSGSLSAPVRTTLSRGTTISIRKRVADKDGYTWYYIYYNRVNGKYQNAGFVSRNALRSTNYYFNYI